MYPAFAGSVTGKRTSACDHAKWFGEMRSMRRLAPVHRVLPRWRRAGFRRYSRKPLGSLKK